MKQCKVCGQMKLLRQFYRDCTHKGGYKGVCRVCFLKARDDRRGVLDAALPNFGPLPEGRARRAEIKRRAEVLRAARGEWRDHPLEQGAEDEQA